MALNVHLMIIDPQNDFMGEDDGSPYQVTMTSGRVLKASLSVKGGVSDVGRLAKLVKRVGHRLEDIHITLDSHRVIDVAHPGMWRDQNGKPPAHFTIIRHDDVMNNIWNPRYPELLLKKKKITLREHMLRYTAALETAGKYLLIIWPEHCRIGSWGHNVYDELMDVLMDWERSEFGNVDYVTKGSNPYTEHYGALMAEVPDPDDPSTQLNGELIRILQDADIIGIAGEASSHCVRETVLQVAENIGDEHLKKFHLLTDCMSPVQPAPGTPDFPKIAGDFLVAMKARGMVLTTSDGFLA